MTTGGGNLGVRRTLVLIDVAAAGGGAGELERGTPDESLLRLPAGANAGLSWLVVRLSDGVQDILLVRESEDVGRDSPGEGEGLIARLWAEIDDDRGVYVDAEEGE